MQMNTQELPSLAGYLFQQSETQGTKAAFGYKAQGQWQEISWSQYAKDVHKAGAALVHLGVGRGDVVCILSFNRYEWVVMHLGAMMIGAVPAGIYETCSASEVAYILHHSEASVLLVDQKEQWEKVEAERANLPHLQKVITAPNCEPINDEMSLSWQTFINLGEEKDLEQAWERYEQILPEDTSTLIYTSGTTGPPKAVMLSHRNLVFLAIRAVDTLGLNPSDSGISYLPLSHIAEQAFTILGPLVGGWKVSFATDRLELLNNLKEVQPTIFMAVPRVWEKFHDGVRTKIAEASGISARILRWALTAGRRAQETGKRGLAFRLADKLVFSKIKAGLGLSNIRFAFTGAAPINPDILRYFAGLNVTIYEVYGQSEGTGGTTFNMPGRLRFGSAGSCFPGIEVKIAEDGEVLLRGDNVFKGYYKDPNATAACLIDGWLHSGDVGYFDDDGFLFITGRKKEILVTSGGKNVAPVPIEEKLKQIPAVSQAVVIGDNRHYLTALITLNADYLLREKLGIDTSNFKPTELAERLAEAGRSLAHFAEDHDILREIEQGVEALNQQLARVTNIRKFAILPRDFSIDTGELTPTLKIKRKVVYENWAERIEALYGIA